MCQGLILKWWTRIETWKFHLQKDPSKADLASVHSPTGAFLGTITMTRLQTLQIAYAQAEGARLPFAEAVAALLARYKDASPTQSSRRTKISNHWATPDKLMTGLTRSLSLTTERFASPLTFSTNMSSYYAVSKKTRPLEQILMPSACHGWGLHKLILSMKLQTWTRQSDGPL